MEKIDMRFIYAGLNEKVFTASAMEWRVDPFDFDVHS